MIHKKIHLFLLLTFIPFLSANAGKVKTDWLQYVNTLQGTNSKFELCRGNTYPTVAMPCGMNFWAPPTAGFISTKPPGYVVSDKHINAAPGQTITLHFR